MAERQTPEQSPKGKAIESADRAPAEETSGAPSAAASIARLQRRAGNAATAAWVQREKDAPSSWKKGVASPKQGGDPKSGPVLGSYGKVAPAPKPAWKKGVMQTPSGPSVWAKTQPKGAPGVKGPSLGGARDVTAIAKKVVDGAIASADKAGIVLGQAVSTMEMGTKSAAESAASAAGFLPEAQKGLATAKGKWASEESGSGAIAATEAEAVSLLWSKADALSATIAGAAKSIGQAHTDIETVVSTIAGARSSITGAVAKLPTNLSPGGQLRASAAVTNAKLSLALTKAKMAATAGSMAAKQAKQAEVDRASKAGDIKKVEAEVWQPLTPGGGPAVIIGRLQQQLNATRAPGTKRLSITAEFSDATAQSVKLFQGVKGSGLADSPTWAKLDKSAPAYRQAGEWLVDSPDGAKVRGTSFKGTGGIEGLTRPWVVPKVTDNGWYAVDSGPAVVEVQQRLNNWYFGQIKAKPVPVTGKYDATTAGAVKEFQKKSGLTADGTVRGPDWDALDKARGPVTEGLIQHNELTEVEGQDRGQTIRYAWKVAPKQLTITVRMNFVEVDPLTLELTDPTLKKDPVDTTKVDPSEVPKLRAGMQTAVKGWVSDIERVWNGFEAKDATPGTKLDPVRITFVPELVGSQGDATINIVPGAHTKNTGGRSDAANWFASDTSSSMGPHEFGHLVGLPDEYSRREEHFVETTGTEAPIGPVTGATYAKDSAKVHAGYLAKKIAGAAPVPDVKDPADPVKKKAVEVVRGKINAFDAAINDLGLNTMRDWWNSAFSRAISEHFSTDPACMAVSNGQSIVDYFVELVRTMPLDRSVAAERDIVWALQEKYQSPLHPFLSTNASIMGTGGSVPDKSAPMAKIGHDHPVQPRHLGPFLKHIGNALGGTWKLP